ncbi:MAG: choline kinase [Zetaproteobacteria bacterium CG06_land_8_20_14_3_00_59_53]|nr:MAG: choline kinase [Zetaproteobacteria bacterium CG2_30_59_37]PIO89261.1 MAG: choline kinase [Zetaproteobacteria bacterium CG23_combo_of_CG06-09_8_20_14_all_59_86]PIQ66197.1 MAG: choline kinase [Zetaproteobacteria bacterium CG11_big_fil_rev_8_21_14_0_20_59_439]PIU70539.1 MAG: choline kinase [Zetaproteobacteria bacterium CG06_land_8_20_14_3_00_59_53]PIU97958.1 MAG: choline kinase [Zetaproteobacteria bacterium CG03_land_8_20_14_0_80_59_51]PIY46949.1 MAG: choline kinase [Zetaproteobacteria ba
MLLHELVRAATGAHSVTRGEVMQSLWSGYGEIVRYSLHGANARSAVVKHVIFPSEVHHPRGWHNDVSHQRKIRSYEVEMVWYHDRAGRCDAHCRVPHCFASETIGEEHLMVLEDLDAAGFPVRRQSLDLDGVRACLSWLAHFHAEFMGETPEGLWPVGTYWHLATRPDELAVMADEALRDASPVVDSMLSNARFQTLVHGDAKLANFCFSADGRRVAAVDFQYVGGGCGMKDVAYFLGSCLSDREHERFEGVLLDHYFATLKLALAQRGKTLDPAALEAEWRTLMPVAQADFYRFLVGWMPSHWKINDYNKRVAQRVVRSL